MKICDSCLSTLHWTNECRASLNSLPINQVKRPVGHPRLYNTKEEKYQARKERQKLTTSPPIMISLREHGQALYAIEYEKFTTDRFWEQMWQPLVIKPIPFVFLTTPTLPSPLGTNWGPSTILV